ncbi:MAG: hypothetical protein LBC72_05525, partial [Spirochaetaceae bacterium]|nr:hypothetical protein [Spirochaetaceae bacterium]
DKTGGTAVFKKNQVGIGYWSLAIKNPGGLETSRATLAAGTFQGGAGGGKGKGMSGRFMFSESYTFLLPISGVLMHFFTAPYYPFGANFRFTYFPVKKRFGAFGIEIEPLWNYLTADGAYYSAEYRVSANFLAAALNLVYQTAFFNNHMALTLRAGGGASVLYDLRIQHMDEKSQWITSIDQFAGFSPLVSGGLSMSYIFSETFFMELGAAYRMCITQTGELPMYIAPSFSIGLYF